MEKSIYSHFVVWSGVAKRSLRSGLVWWSAFCKLESIIHHVWSALESCLSIYGNDLCVGKKTGISTWISCHFFLRNKQTKIKRIGENKRKEDGREKRIWIWNICEVKWSWTGSIRCTKIENIMQFIWLYLCAACEFNLIVECAVLLPGTSSQYIHTKSWPDCKHR